MRKVIFVFLAMLSLFSTQSYAEIIHREYQGFEVWVDCDLRSAVLYHYIAMEDRGNLKRHDRFYFDESIPSHCQQKSVGTYKGGEYDRGHLYPANHADSDPRSIQQSNFMTNVLPQTRQLNRGAMLESEKLIECARDRSPVEVYGGIFPSETPLNTKFLSSHGVQTPAYFWKVIIQGDRILSLVFPNDTTATASKLNDFVVSVEEIEARLGAQLPVGVSLRDHQSETVWAQSGYCDWS